MRLQMIVVVALLSQYCSFVGQSSTILFFAAVCRSETSELKRVEPRK